MKLLDAGAGDQKYRKFCNHLEYYAQDLGEYTIDQKKMIGSLGLGGTSGYNYGTIDFTGDIWNIDVRSETFDVVLCTEVLEHVPYPIETIKELSRILKPGGTLILTAPSNCLRHMDPFFFSSGFSDRWYERILLDNGLEPKAIKPIGDYFQWLAVEMFRTMRTNRFSFILIFPAFVFLLLRKLLIYHKTHFASVIT
jgi:SAM-dependent methyltransferase